MRKSKYLLNIFTLNLTRGERTVKTFPLGVPEVNVSATLFRKIALCLCACDSSYFKPWSFISIMTFRLPAYYLSLQWNGRFLTSN